MQKYQHRMIWSCLKSIEGRNDWYYQSTSHSIVEAKSDADYVVFIIQEHSDHLTNMAVKTKWILIIIYTNGLPVYEFYI